MPTKTRRLDRVSNGDLGVVVAGPRKGLPRTTRAPRHTRSDYRKDWKPRFLKCLRINGCVSHACEAAGIARSTAYLARQEDEDFAVAWADAEDHSTEALEAEGIRRALETSDLLLMFFLKARKPATYRENATIWRNELNEEHLGIIAEVWKASVGMAGLNAEQEDRLKEEFARRLAQHEEKVPA